MSYQSSASASTNILLWMPRFMTQMGVASASRWRAVRAVFTVDYIATYFSMFALLSWLTFAYWRVANLAHMPDEVWFYITALNHYKDPNFNPLVSENSFAYGGGWFTLYHFFIVVSDFFFAADFSKINIKDTSLLFQENNKQALYIPMYLMRLVSVSALTAIVIFFTKRVIDRKRYSVPALVLLYLLPMMYWSGKLASPDAPAAAALFFGCHFFFRKKFIVAYFFMGLSVGVKISSAPIVVVMIVWHLIYALNIYLNFENESRDKILQTARKLKRSEAMLTLYFSLTLVVFVFLFCNIFAIVETKVYFNNISDFSSRFAPGDFNGLSSLVKNRLFNYDSKLWDLTHPGSLSYWSTSFFAVILLLLGASIFSLSNRTAILFWLFFSVQLAICIRQPAFGWNWFPFIILLPLLITFYKETKVSRVFLMFVLAVSFFHNLPIIINEVSNLKSHQDNIQYYNVNKDQIVTLIESYSQENKMKVRRKVNLIEIGVDFPGSKSFNDSMWKIKHRFRVGDMVMIGDRVQRYHPDLVQHEILNKFEVKHIEIGFISIYFIKERIRKSSNQ